MINNKINIAFLTHGDRNIGGGELSWYSIISELNKDLFNPIVFFSKQNSIIENLKQDNIPVKKIDISERIYSLYRYHLQFNPINILQYIFFIANASWNLFQLLKFHRIEIIHVHDNLSKIIGIPAAKFARVKIITHCRDQLGNVLIDKILLFCQKYFMDRIFCVSTSVGNLFSNNGKIPDNVLVVSHGIILTDWIRSKLRKQNITEINNPNPVILGIIATFDNVKGHLYLFEALKLLHNEGIRNFYCEVIGDGREKRNLFEWVSNNGMGEYINFNGYISFPYIKKYFEELDILIVPSLQEAFGRVAVEGMAMELPVIASKVGGLSEVIDDGNTGILVPPANPRALANAIKYLMNNPKLRLKMGMAGNRRAKKLFDFNIVFKNTEKIIYELMNDNFNRKESRSNKQQYKLVK